MTDQPSMRLLGKVIVVTGAARGQGAAEAAALAREGAHVIATDVEPYDPPPDRSALVSQVRDEEDLRRTLLSLTDEGAELLDSLIAPAERINELLLRSLPAGERAMAVDILSRLASLDEESLRDKA